MGTLALLGCFVPIDVLLTATGSTLAFSYMFIALAALVGRRGATAGCGYRMPLWPLPPVLALIAIGTIFVVGVLDPTQWPSLGIAFGIVVAGFAYYACYLRPRAGTHLVLLDAVDDDDIAATASGK